MIGYHGTSTVIASNLKAGNVNVFAGGGELGRGFYTGEHLWAAKAWAFNRYGNRQKNVVEFNVPDSQVLLLNFKCVSASTAALIRSNIRLNGQSRTYTFNVDMIWSPIVGRAVPTGDQHKWESLVSQNLLNGLFTNRVIV